MAQMSKSSNVRGFAAREAQAKKDEKKPAKPAKPAPTAAAAASSSTDEPPAKRQKVYHGERTCQKDGCSNGAYYSSGGRYLCGVHSRNKSRTELPQMPKELKAKRQKERMDAHEATITAATKANLAAGESGKLKCHKLHMRKNPPLVPGWRLVRPNFLHAGCTDGLGCATLSPKAMANVAHGQPGLPDPASSLEHLHQGNKVYPFLADAKGDPSAAFFAVQKAMYKDKPRIPYRHLTDFLRANPALCKEHKIEIPEGKLGNAPLYSLWTLPNGVKKRFTYVQSRQFYCCLYERLVLALPEFHELKARLARGENLILCGYDAYEPDRTLSEHYLDPARPFGHELVLYTLLTIDDPNEYP
jgi:hypothetical protein